MLRVPGNTGVLASSSGISWAFPTMCIVKNKPQFRGPIIIQVAVDMWQP